jgi:hypothetical protein
MSRAAEWLRRVLGLLPLTRRLRAVLGSGAAQPFAGSADYWRERYAKGGNSGPGSYGKFAEFKARVLNAWFREAGLSSAIEFGCGDGNQLRLLEVDDYLGVDVSAQAVARCRAAYPGAAGRRFMLADDYAGERAECALSLDVIYHLVEDEAFDRYMRRLFAAATRCVVIYSSNQIGNATNDGAHVRHRRFTDWVAQHQPGWRLERHVPNEYPYRGDWRTGSFADFYIYLPAAAT